MINALLSAIADAVVGAEWGQQSRPARHTTMASGTGNLDTRAGHDRCCDPEAAVWHVLPGLAAREAQALGGGVDHRGRRPLTRWSLNPTNFFA